MSISELLVPEPQGVPQEVGLAFFDSLKNPGRAKEALHPRTYWNMGTAAAMTGIPVYFAAKPSGPDGLSSYQRQKVMDEMSGASGSGHEREKRIYDAISRHPALAALASAALSAGVAGAFSQRRLNKLTFDPGPEVISDKIPIDFHKQASLDGWAERSEESSLNAAEAKKALIKIGMLAELYTESQLASMDASLAEDPDWLVKQAGPIGELARAFARKAAGSKWGWLSRMGGREAERQAVAAAKRAVSPRLLQKLEAKSAEAARLGDKGIPVSDSLIRRRAAVGEQLEALRAKGRSHVSTAEEMRDIGRVGGAKGGAIGRYGEDRFAGDVAKAKASFNPPKAGVPPASQAANPSALKPGKGFGGNFTATAAQGFKKPIRSAVGVAKSWSSPKFRAWAKANPGAAAGMTAGRLAGPVAYGAGGVWAGRKLLGSGQEKTASAPPETSDLAKELAKRLLTKKLVVPVAALGGGFYLGRRFPKREDTTPQQAW